MSVYALNLIQFDLIYSKNDLLKSKSTNLEEEGKKCT